MRRGVTRVIELVRSRSMPRRRTWRRSERILVAVNLTEEGGELVTWTLTHGSRSGDTVTVIHVVEPCAKLETRKQKIKWERQKKDMLNTLSHLVTYCRTHYDVPHLSTVVEVVESSSIGDAIVEEAQSLEATQVILGKQKPRRLSISPRKMTGLGELCVQNLEPYCDVIIVRKGKVLVRKPGQAKFRGSLETLIRSSKKQELYEQFEETNNAMQVVVGKDFTHLTKSRHSRKESLSDSPDNSLTRWRLMSSSFSLPSISSPSDHLSVKFTNSSRDSSFSSSSGASESSPISVLKVSNHRKVLEGFVPPQLPLLRDPASSDPISSQAEWLKGEGGPAPRPRSRSSSISLESVPEFPKLPAEDRKNPEAHPEEARALVAFCEPQLEDRKEEEDTEQQLALVVCSELQLEDRKEEDTEQQLALVACSAPQLEDMKEEEEDKEQQLALVVCSELQLEDRKEEDKEQQLALVCVSAAPELEEDGKDGAETGSLLALVCSSPQESESWEGEELGGQEEGALVLADVYPRESSTEDEEDELEEQCEPMCLANCSPPRFARTCSAIRYNLSEDGLQSLSKDVNLELPEVRRFSYEELRVAADNFAVHNVVGTGGASSVYKAQLRDGSMVALKRLVDNMAGEKEFMMEMMMLICTLNHPNLVTMIGFCAENSHRLIAYKLLARGSLERNLHSDAKSTKLSWEQRQKIAFGASRGLAYLHSFSPMAIIHRDIKTSNILIADDFEAQISDFGLARWLSECDTTDDQVSCAGTFGYLAPESLMYGGFNERTDVFAFGVVLLELISGRRPMDESLPDAQQSLVLWARTLQQNGKTHFLVDQSLTDINPQQFKRMMYTAFLCVQVSPEDRPTMERVVRLLDPNCSYSPAILQPDISAPPFISMPELNPSHIKSPIASSVH